MRESADFDAAPPLPDLARDFVQGELTHNLAWDLTEARGKCGLNNPQVAWIKTHVEAWASLLRLKWIESLRPHLKAGTSDESLLAAMPLGLFNEIKTKKKERDVAMKNTPYKDPEAIALVPGSKQPEDTVARYNIGDLLELKLQNDAEFRKTIIATSERWKTGEYYKKEPDVLKDAADGAVMRNHPELMRPAAAHEKNDLRIAQLFNTDDVEAPRPPSNFTLQLSTVWSVDVPCTR